MTGSAWPFSDAPNTAVISLQRIVKHGHPILYVLHDVDGAWQFLDGEDVSKEDAEIVSLQSIIMLDPSLLELADLPRGRNAWRRTQCSSWQRST
jgi:hypothetical protein